MSHFVVGVLIDRLSSDAIERAMAPYQENNMLDCPKEYLEFFDMEDEMREEYETETVTQVKTPEGALVFRHSSDIPREEQELVEIPFTVKYPTFEEFAKDYHGHAGPDEETGRYGYWENPQAKWDWYEVGGRWTNMLLVKDTLPDDVWVRGGHYGQPVDESAPEGYMWVDGAKIKDIEFEVMSNLIIERRKENWGEIKKLLADGNTTEAFFKYGVKEGTTRDEYINAPDFTLFAFLNGITGDWYETGRMGWWGTNSATEEEEENWEKSFRDRFIDHADPEHYLVIVDCHI